MRQPIRTLTTSYEALLRIFRNAVVTWIRAQATAARGPQASQALRRLLEWDQLRESAQHSRLSAIDCPVADDFDLLDIAHLRRIFSKDGWQLLLALGPNARA